MSGPGASAIRLARPGDAPAIRRLQGFLSHPSPALLEAALAELGAPPDARALSLLVSPDASGSPVGYALAVCGNRGGRGDDPGRDAGPEGAAHVAELAVDPDRRREGRASALLRAVASEANGPVTVHVAADDDPARRLYRSFGFVERRRLPERFGGEPGLLLRYDP